MSRFAAPFFLGIWILAIIALPPAHAQSLIDQYALAQKPSLEIKPLGDDLFGEQISLLDGSINFSYTDVSVATNHKLPMTVGRVLSVQGQSPDSRGSGTYRGNGAFGAMWDILVPNLRATADARLGWVGTDRSQNRCSQGHGAPAVLGVYPFSMIWYDPEHYYSGVTSTIPGYGEEQLLPIRTEFNTISPSDGFTYVKASVSGWRGRCIQQLKRGTGEGFIVVLPDGTSYQFDWLVSRPVGVLEDATCKFTSNQVLTSPQAADFAGEWTCTEGVAVPREEYILFATVAKDRFGNTLTYTYDAQNPMRLQKIESSDGARIDLTYYSTTGQIQTIKSGTRTWTYYYTGTVGGQRLQRVVLPDLTEWTYEYSSGYTDVTEQNPKVTWAGCTLNIGTRTTSVAPGPRDTGWIKIGHPSGANGEFKFRRVMHGTKETEQHCEIQRDCGLAGTCASYTRILGAPSAHQIASIYQKTISGPGISTETWNYAYQPSWTAPYTSTTVVSHSSGHVERYKFGMDKTSNYGQLLQKTVGTSTQVLRTENFSYLNSRTGQNFGGIGWDYSTAMYSWAGQLAKNPRPLIKRETIQQGRKFLWQVNTGCLQSGAYCFDAHVRPLSVTKKSEAVE